MRLQSTYEGFVFNNLFFINTKLRWITNILIKEFKKIQPRDLILFDK